MKRSAVVVASLGRPASGKSRLLHHLYTSKTERVISLDVNDEVCEMNPAALRAVGFVELMDVLDVASNHKRWHIAAVLDVEDVRELFTLCAPPIGSQDSLSRSLGGLAIECGEVHTFLPNAGAKPEILDGLRRGRHYLLSIFAATQRPASCARDLTAFAHHTYMFQQSERRDLLYIRDQFGRDIAREVQSLPLHHSVAYHALDGRAELLNPSYRPVRPLAQEAIAI